MITIKYIQTLQKIMRAGYKTWGEPREARPMHIVLTQNGLAKTAGGQVFRQNQFAV
jgi:hypothetical protein